MAVRVGDDVVCANDGVSAKGWWPDGTGLVQVECSLVATYEGVIGSAR